MSQNLQQQLILANRNRQHSAKEEVASVLLSAMMGYIIESWESEPLILPLKHTLAETETLPTDVIQREDISKIVKTSITEFKTSSIRKRSSKLKDKNQKKRKLLEKQTRSKASSIPTVELLLASTSDTLSIELTSESFESNNLKKILKDDSYQSLSSSFRPQSSSIISSKAESINKLLSDWWFQENDQQVVIHFKQGNVYEGPLSRCSMHGKGKFLWADGSKYEGDFDEGEITGNGILIWSDQSWYEGGFYKGYRHGYGLLVLNSYVCYAGNWFLGQKHGLGYLNYKDPQIQQDYYNGEWNLGCREGTGLRHYSSGARYAGQWCNHLKHGLGTMVWTNNDVYSGNWNCGEIEGYGEYTWNTFFNKQLAVPQENCYYGMWKKGIREGNGTLELESGAIIYGCWSDGLKHGGAQVVCSNGVFVHSQDLFVNDCVAQIPNKDPKTLYHIPINAPDHDIDLSAYTERLAIYRRYCGEMRIENNVFKVFECFMEKQNNTIDLENVYLDEEKWLQKVILLNLNRLKLIYKMYAEIGCSYVVNFTPIMTRLTLWQMWRDCGFHKRGLSLAEIDIILASNPNVLMESMHYPFERIQFWQFLHCLIELAWQFYVLNIYNIDFTMPSILASALHTLVNEDILLSFGKNVGNALFKYRDLLSIDATYWLYRSLGETLSARTVIKNIVITDQSEQSPIPYYPSCALQGTNIFGVGGKLMYLQSEEPLPFKKQTSDIQREPIYTQPLSSLNDIGKKRAVRNLLIVCPSIKSNDLIINLDYQLVFLEFYELLLLCAMSSVKKSAWIQKRRELREKERLEKIEEEKLKLEEEAILSKTKPEDKKKPKSDKK